MQILTIIILIGGLLLFFILGYILNSRTPLPEGIDLPSMECQSCSQTGCPSKPKAKEQLKKEILEEIRNNSEKV